MASAQVVPGSRKQEHLEAGKRRLEEFRKKKAAERPKKAATISQLNPSDVSRDQKKPLETENERIMSSDGAGTSDGPGGAVETFALSANSDSSKNDISKEVEQRSLKDADTDLLSLSKSFTGVFQQHTSNDSFGRYNAYGHSEAISGNPGVHIESQSALPYRSLSDQSVALQTQPGHDFDGNSNQSGIYDMESLQSKEKSSFWKDSLFKSPMSHVFSSSANATIFQQQPKPSYVGPLENGVESIQPNSSMNGSSLEVENDMNGSKQLNEHANTIFGQRNYGSLPGGFGASVQISESIGFSSNVTRSSNNTLMYMSMSKMPASRSRPSFLDSLNVPRASLGTSSQQTDSQKGTSVSHDKNSSGVDELGSSIFQKPLLENETVAPFTRLKPQSGPTVFDHSPNFSAPSTNGSDLLSSNADRKQMEQKHEYYSPKQDEGFAALEQHIEDLTQEKFSLQRALEASRALADSLAAENSSLTDSYNQQRGVVNQLKSDMENLQEEIKGHLVELEAVKIENANSQLECNAADERAKLLASEVIGLEEKALRLRSSELKLERQLEDLQSEMTSYRKRMSSLERERQDLQLTIDALQEEKKLLQSKLRKALASGNSMDVSRSPNNKKDVSTSTEDATPGTSNQGDQDDTSVIGSDNLKFPVLPENVLSNLEDSSVYIPPDQLRMIQNINSLISELVLEKEELMQALASESSQCSKLKDLNKELSRKLESQTQRLELLTAQSMVNENTQMRLPDSRTVLDNPTYADEGDEVVERVLGWIMKLFPGGPSKRRTSKLL